MMEIRKVGVIGSGVMGMGIAAQIANAGIPVRLLDMPAKDGPDRNAIAADAIKKALKTEPAPFMDPKNARLITPGNLEDDLESLSDCDWIVEVIIENVEIKRDLYARLEEVRKDSAAISSNTSSIPLNLLIEGRSDSFKKHFLITHFFNPPRYMRLLELVTGPDTDAAVAQAISEFCDVRLGKGVVPCKDTPAFIANRIGTFWGQVSINGAFDFDLTVEEADAITGRPMGLPKTATFALMDLVGIDLLPLLSQSLLATLPPDDPYRAVQKDQPLVTRMIEDGYTGRKGKGGFYRINREGGGKVKEAINLKTGEYAPADTKPVLASLEASKAAGKKNALRALVEHEDKGGQYAWYVISHGLSYAASLVGEIADDIVAIDRAMKLGYNWKLGPFELIDSLGTDWFAAKLAEAGMPVPDILQKAAGRPFYAVEDGKLRFLQVDGSYADVVRPDGVLLLEDIKRAGPPIKKNPSASLWDIGDGVVCLEFTSKMNALDPLIMEMIGKAVALIGDGQGDYKALVVYNEGTNFSVGANLGLAMFAVNIGMWPQIDQNLEQGQMAYKSLKYAPFPVIGAPAGMALGGACEILLHCDAIQAAAESYIGLVEVGVGIVPGWGGCKEMLIRTAEAEQAKLAKHKLPAGWAPNTAGPIQVLAPAFQNIGMAKVAKSAAEAKKLHMMRPGDGITMNRDRLLAEAKAKALAMVEGYTPPEEPTFRLPGKQGMATLELMLADLRLQGQVTPHDDVVVNKLGEVLTGGDTDIVDTVDEDEMLRLEREALVSLVKTPGTIARIEHMLETGKPLRN